MYFYPETGVGLSFFALSGPNIRAVRTCAGELSKKILSAGFPVTHPKTLPVIGLLTAPAAFPPPCRTGRGSGHHVFERRDRSGAECGDLEDQKTDPESSGGPRVSAHLSA